MKIKQLLENWIILEEGTNYAEMFSSVDRQINLIIDEYRQLFGPDSKYESTLIKTHEGRKRQMIIGIKGINDRQDFRIWMTRIAKIYHIGWLASWIEGDVEEFEGNYDGDGVLNIVGDMVEEKIKLTNDFLGMTTGEAGSSFSDLIWVMQHFFSLPIPEIQEFRFEKNHTYKYIYDLFSDYEYEWQQLGDEDENLVPEQGQIIMDFGNGIRWWDLEDASCSAEGDAMGHCGNSPYSGDPNQTILSLREESNRKGYHKPLLTFVYHKKEKGLGERKGRGNSKPAAKYHKYIIPLIMEPFIERFLEGRSYLAENDFQITDLSNWREIVEQKPDLLPLRQYIKEIGFDDYIKSKIEFDSRYSAETVIDDGIDLHLIYNKSRIEETMYGDTNSIGFQLANMLLYGNKGRHHEFDWMQDQIDKLGQKLFPNLNPFKWYELFKNAEDFYKPQSSAVRIADQIRNLCANAFQDMLIDAVRDPSKITGKVNLFVKETSGRDFAIEPASHVFNTITWEGYATNNGIGITINKDTLFGHVDPYVLSDDFILVLSAKEFELIPRGSYGPYVRIGDIPYIKLDVSYEFDEFVVETDIIDIIFNQQMTAPFFRPYIDGIKKEFLELFSEYEHIAPEPFLR